MGEERVTLPRVSPLGRYSSPLPRENSEEEGVNAETPNEIKSSRTAIRYFRLRR